MPARPAAAPRLAPSLLLLLACEIGPSHDGFEPPSPRAPVRIPDPVAPAQDDASTDLLQQYVDRPAIDPRAIQLWELTFQQKLLAIALVSTAASDRLEDLALALTPDARWGLPDPRRFGSRPIFDDDHGAAFLAAFRAAAQRFPKGSTYHTQPLTDGAQGVVRIGAEPYWTYWVNGRDRIYLRMIVYRGRPYIDYVGFFESLPEEPLHVTDSVIPPLAPPLRRRGPDSGEGWPLPE
jgi:hypothetical protein